MMYLISLGMGLLGGFLSRLWPTPPPKKKKVIRTESQPIYDKPYDPRPGRVVRDVEKKAFERELRESRSILPDS